MTTTKSDLATAVLQELGVLAAGETASAEDSQKVQATIDAVHAEYEAEGRATWDVDETPDNVVDPLKVIVAERLLEVFGVGGETAQRIRGKLQLAQSRFLRQIANSYGGEPVQTQYF